MSESSRRDILATAIGATLIAGAPRAFAQEESDEVAEQMRAVRAAGFTSEETECWNLCADLAGKYASLERIHATDAQHQADWHEVAHAIHVVQTRLLARPTYRKYVEAIKSGG